MKDEKINVKEGMAGNSLVDMCSEPRTKIPSLLNDQKKKN
jgi:hypothetical protein